MGAFWSTPMVNWIIQGLAVMADSTQSLVRAREAPLTSICTFGKVANETRRVSSFAVLSPNEWTTADSETIDQMKTKHRKNNLRR